MDRFEIDDYIRKGFKVYEFPKVLDKDKYCKVLYYRFYLDNFYVKNLLFVKNRKHEGSN